MVDTKQLHFVEIMEYLLFAAMHVVYSAWTKDAAITQLVFIYAVGMSIITAGCLIVISNEWYKQIGFTLCVMMGVHLIGTAMGSLAFGICIFMAAGTLISIYGDRKLNCYYIIIVNMTIVFDLIMEYDVITAKVPIHYYVMMIMTCEIYLLTETYMVLLYQQKVEEIQIQNELLNIAQKSKDEFLANMSHEIRTPMNAIVGMSELIMREENTDPKVAQYCHSIQSSGNNLLAIINDILDFSKIESGKMNITYEPYSIAASLNEVVNTAMFRKGYKDIDIIVDVSPNMPRLLNGDDIRIRQILTNIITNAVKFTDKGYIFIKAECYERNGDTWLRIVVKDSGTGIRREDLAHLFESFKRLDSKKNRSIEGTGLGLPICKRLVELMHGTIRIQSEYGKGTTVTVDIPQSIVDKSPSLTLLNKNVNVITFLLPDDKSEEQRDMHYNKAVDNMWEALNVHNEKCIDLETFKKMVETGKYTHVIAGTKAYLYNREYICKLTKDIKVFVLNDPIYSQSFEEGIYSINLPFCSVSVVPALNGEAYYNEITDDNIGTSFTAPEANVLVVDDNDLNRKVAEGILKLYKVNVILADSGKTAINILNKKPVDIVFMDHMMPEMDGIETTKVIRQNGTEKYRNVPIIAMTANVVNDSKFMFLKSGFQDFLPKPVKVREIGVTLKHWLPRTLIVENGDIGDNDIDNTDDKTVTGNYITISPIDDGFSETSSWNSNSENVTKDTLKKIREVVSEDIVQKIPEDVSKDTSENNPEDDQTETKHDRDFVEINADVAIENMGGQKDLFKELLEYCLELEEKRWDEIQKEFDDKNWEEYTILVHALKGGMRSLGIEELALAAQGQEFACKEGRIDDAIKGHGPLKELYDFTHRSIEHYLEAMI